MDEFHVFLAARGEFAHCQVVQIQAPTGAAACVFVAHRNEAALPSLWKDRRFGRYAMGLVTERFVEDGFLSDRAVDQDGALGKFKRKNIRFHRTDKDLLPWLWHLPEESLAANHHDFIRVGIGRRGAHDMLKLLSGHADMTSRWPCVRPG